MAVREPKWPRRQKNIERPRSQLTCQERRPRETPIVRNSLFNVGRFFFKENNRRLRSATLKSRVPNNRRPWQVNYERPWGKWGPGRGLRREGGHRGWGASKRTTPRSKEQMKSDSLPPSPSLPSCPRCSVSSSGWLGRRPFHHNKFPLGGSDGAESIAYWEARTPSLPL